MHIVKRGDRYRVRVQGAGLPFAGLSRTFNDRGEAAAWACKVEDAARGGTLPERNASATTIEQLVQSYIAGCPARNQQGRDRYAALARSKLGRYGVGALIRRAVRLDLDSRPHAGLKSPTWNRELSAPRVVLKHARDLDIRVDWRAPTDGVRGAASPSRAGRISLADQVELECAAGWIAPRLPAWITVALATGCRHGEQFALIHADLDKTAQWLRTPGTKTRDSVRRFFWHPTLLCQVIQRSMRLLRLQRTSTLTCSDSGFYIAWEGLCACT